jgi:DnaK suppressor protein
VTKTAASKAPAKKAPGEGEDMAVASTPAPTAAPAPTAMHAAATPTPVMPAAKTASGRGRGGSKYGNVPEQAPLPPSTSRFADRFAPARAQTRAVFTPDATPRPPIKVDPRLASAWKTKAGRELTEDELLAMPEAEYMNDKQLEFFRARLQTLKDDLLSNADETTEHLREDTSIVPDPADRATIEEEHALELRTRDRERKLLKKISQSLARIDSGEYGFCDETGEPIGIGRLLARPTATLSLEAQQRRELKQKMFGD